jgi:hypothetical protein
MTTGWSKGIAAQVSLPFLNAPLRLAWGAFLWGIALMLLALREGAPARPGRAGASALALYESAQCGWVKGRDYDRMIAAHAISSGSIFVTDNQVDFRDIPGLSMENWVV